MNFKEGLDYFPLAIDFFEDEKIEFVSARFGMKGEIITIRLLSRIYRQGYFLAWDEDNALLLAKKCGEGVTAEIVNQVVEELIKRDFFDREIYVNNMVLTSRGIQRRFFEVVKRRKKITVIQEYLVTEFQNIKDDNIIIQNVNILEQNDGIITNSKGRRVEEVKEGKESKVPQHHDAVFFRDADIFNLEIFQEKLIGSPYENANVAYYHERAYNWSESNGEKKKSWIHTVRNWMASDMKENKFVTKDFNPQKNGKQATGAAVAVQSAFDAIDQHYAKNGNR